MVTTYYLYSPLRKLVANLRKDFDNQKVFPLFLEKKLANAGTQERFLLQFLVRDDEIMMEIFGYLQKSLYLCRQIW